MLGGSHRDHEASVRIYSVIVAAVTTYDNRYTSRYQDARLTFHLRNVPVTASSRDFRQFKWRAKKTLRRMRYPSTKWCSEKESSRSCAGKIRTSLIGLLGESKSKTLFPSQPCVVIRASSLTQSRNISKSDARPIEKPWLLGIERRRRVPMKRQRSTYANCLALCDSFNIQVQ